MITPKIWFMDATPEEAAITAPMEGLATASAVVLAEEMIPTEDSAADLEVILVVIPDSTADSAAVLAAGLVVILEEEDLAVVLAMVSAVDQVNIPVEMAMAVEMAMVGEETEADLILAILATMAMVMQVIPMVAEEVIEEMGDPTLAILISKT